jgi:serine phosphatase RsbU (regulator of sigma subunit)
MSSPFTPNTKATAQLTGKISTDMAHLLRGTIYADSGEDSHHRHKNILTVLALSLLAAAFVIDWLTGNEVASSLFYVIAIMFGAWFLGRRAGLVLALLSVIGWMVAYYLVGDPFSKLSVFYWNVFVEISIYLITALAVAQAKAGLERIHTLAAQLEQANRALDRESLAVGELQRKMLPQTSPEIPGYECETLYQTSTRAGGDYYDFLELSGGRVGILVADASGHGAPAAVLMGMMRVLFHAASEEPDLPDRVLSRLNSQLMGALPQGFFVTACYVVLDPESGGVQYSLAGHDAPIRIQAANGNTQRLENRGGPLLGFFANAIYESGSAMLESGDTLVLHTDGVTEAMSPSEELFGDVHLFEALLESRISEPAEIGRHLFARIDAHRAGAPALDDLTLLILRRLRC